MLGCRLDTPGSQRTCMADPRRGRAQQYGDCGSGAWAKQRRAQGENWDNCSRIIIRNKNKNTCSKLDLGHQSRVANPCFIPQCLFQRWTERAGLGKSILPDRGNGIERGDGGNGREVTLVLSSLREVTSISKYPYFLCF